MNESHFQSRALVDALAAGDQLLQLRGTAFKPSEPRAELARSFAPVPYPRFFDADAYTAAEFSNVKARLEESAPLLAAQLKPPAGPQDIVLVGACELELPFLADPNGTNDPLIRLRNDRVVVGASVSSKKARRYSNGVVALSTAEDEEVCFLQLDRAPENDAAAAARKAIETKGQCEERGLTLKFPAAETSRLPDYSWVMGLQSTCELYYVANFLNEGQSRVDELGFSLKELEVIDVGYTGDAPEYPVTSIDGPFLVYFASQGGLHAATWFDDDSFTDWEPPEHMPPDFVAAITPA